MTPPSNYFQLLSITFNYFQLLCIGCRLMQMDAEFKYLMILLYKDISFFKDNVKIISIQDTEIDFPKDYDFVVLTPYTDYHCDNKVPEIQTMDFDEFESFVDDMCCAGEIKFNNDIFLRQPGGCRVLLGYKHDDDSWSSTFITPEKMQNLISLHDHLLLSGRINGGYISMVNCCS